MLIREGPRQQETELSHLSQETPLSDHTVPSVFNPDSQQQSELPVKAAQSRAPAQLAFTHFPTHSSSSGICSRRVEFKFRSQQAGQTVRGLSPSKVRRGVLKRPPKSDGRGPGGGTHSILRVGMRPAAFPAYSWLWEANCIPAYSWLWPGAKRMGSVQSSLRELASHGKIPGCCLCSFPSALNAIRVFLSNIN